MGKKQKRQDEDAKGDKGGGGDVEARSAKKSKAGADAPAKSKDERRQERRHEKKLKQSTFTPVKRYDPLADDDEDEEMEPAAADSSSDDSDEEPAVKKKPAPAKQAARRNEAPSESDDDSESSSEEEEEAKPAPAKKPAAKPKQPAPESDDSSSEEDEEEEEEKEDDDDDDDDRPAANKAASAAPAAAAAAEGDDEAANKAMRKAMKAQRKAERRAARRAEAEAAGPAGAAGGAAGVAVEGTRLYVGGLPYTHDEASVRQLFEECGEVVEVDLMRFPDSGKFRGIAIVGFATNEATAAAMEYNGTDYEGRILTIKPAKPKEPKVAAAAGEPAAGEAGDAEGAAAAAAAAAAKKQLARQMAPELDTESNVVYVGSLAWNVDEDALNGFFAGLKIVRVQWGLDKVSGGFKGYAHVEFADREQASKAVGFNGKVLLGRSVRVLPEAKRHTPRGGADAKGDALSAPAVEGGKRAYVTNLDYGIDAAVLDKQLHRIFEGCKIEGIRRGTDKASGEFRGFCHVDFATPADLQKAIGMSGSEIMGRPIKVAYAQEKKPQSGPGAGGAGGRGAGAGRGRGAGGGKKRGGGR